MVVQNYNVQTSSQRTFMSLQSTTMLATKNLGSPNVSTQSKQVSDPKDKVQIATGSLKKPNNGNSFGHLLQAHRRSQNDGLNLLSTKRKPKPPRVPKQGKAGNKNMPSNPNELRERMMELMFELILGKSSSSSSSLFSNNGSTFMHSESSESFSLEASFFGNFYGVSGGGEAARAGWQIEQFRYEQEQVSYQAQGVINTADGRTINVDINMQMSRQYTEYMNIDVEVTRSLCDPLVINYGGTAASLLGDETFQFDLTSDGSMEKLAMLGEGSGFLALDKNGDGKINDGSELFGPNSGCGFTELRAHDRDGNGWIDEADDVFDKLTVWHRDKDGNDTAYTLKELGIGAIYLGDIATEFSFKGDNNETLGVMRSTSFFLKEDGGAGTVSHIDLAV